jgi:rubrerythrin
MTLAQDTVDDLREKMNTLEKKYQEILRTMEEHHREQLKKVIKHANIDPIIICLQCGKSIYLDSYTYWNVEDTDIRCQFCKALMAVTTEDGQIKKTRLRDPTK